MGISEAFSTLAPGLRPGSASPQSIRPAWLDLLYNNITGAGFTILRNGIGSSPMNKIDFMQSIEPPTPGLPDNLAQYISLQQFSHRYATTSQALRASA